MRNEFALLEEKGYLTHPHTSAGRVPTDLGYREFVDHLMSAPHPRSLPRPGMAPGAPGAVQPEDLTGEIDTALRQATDAMSRATNLLALALAPRVSGARLCHVELLTLHPTQLMYVFIVSTGGVMKGVIDWPQPVDPGLVEWARTYLNETLNEQTLTARLIRRDARESRAEPPRGGLPARPWRPAFERLVDEQSQEELFVGGTSRLLAEPQTQGRLVAARSAHASGRTVPAAPGAADRSGQRHRGGAHRQRARGHGSAAVLRGGGQLRPAAAAAGHGEPGRAHPHGLREGHRHGARDGAVAVRPGGGAVRMIRRSWRRRPLRKVTRG